MSAEDPNGTIVYITATQGTEAVQGSGVLIAPDEVLTASHVVYNPITGVASNIKVSPDHSAQYGAVDGTSLGSVTFYNPILYAPDDISLAASQDDFAIIDLSMPFPTLGEMGLQANFAGGAVNVSGYPDFANGSLITLPETVSKDPNYSLLDGTALGEGSSGGPVWVIGADGEPEVVGIVSSSQSTTDEGFFTLITSAVLATIDSRILKDEGRTSVTYSPAEVVDDLDRLQLLASAGQLAGITITGPGIPSITIEAGQLASDAQALRFIGGTFDIACPDVGVQSAMTDLQTLNPGATTNLRSIAFIDGAMQYGTASPAAQIARLYQAALGRAPDPIGLAGWVSLLQSGFPLQGVATGFLTSPEFQTRYPAAAGNAGDFVTQLYQNVLGRAPDPEGYANWVGALTSGQMDAARVLLGFSESPEDQANNATTDDAGIWVANEQAAQVARLYYTTLDRAPDLSGLTQWATALEDGGLTLTQEADDFMASAEFQSKYGNLSNAGFVTTLYENALGRAPDPAGAAGWLGLLNSGTARDTVVVGFSESPEHQQMLVPVIEAKGIVFS